MESRVEIMKKTPLFAVLATMFLFARASSAAVIHVDPGGYPGEYRIAGGPFVVGPGAADLPAGGPYQLGLRFVGDVFFEVDAGGNVTSLTPDSAYGDGDTLVLRNTTITVNPGSFGGDYRVLFFPFGPGIRTHALVPGLGMSYVCGLFAGDISFQVDAAGNVINHTPNSATASGSTLTFRTATVNVDPGAYPGAWGVWGNPLQFGAHPATVVTGLGMQWFVGIHQDVGDIHFQVDTAGNLVNLAPGSADIVGTTLVLKNTIIYVNPSSPTVEYDIIYFPIGTGPRNFVLIPGSTLSWSLEINNPDHTYGGRARFTVTDLCAISPDAVSVGSNDFDLSCSPFVVCVDHDNDGYGAPGDASCPQGAATDCDDLDSSVHPGAPELCDGRDNDCSGSPGPEEVDADGDHYRICQGDCNDANASQNPQAPELPGNSADENCDGSLGACDPTAVWRNHGQFVRCVANEVSFLVSHGTITEAQGDDLVRQAAQSNVGK
jgi:hypothetical protein